MAASASEGVRMTAAARQFLALPVRETLTPITTVNQPTAEQCRTAPTAHVRFLPTITDAQRESAITKAGELMQQFMQFSESAHVIWERDSCFHANAEMSCWRHRAHEMRELMEELIRGRSAEQVAEMERRLGLG